MNLTKLTLKRPVSAIIIVFALLIFGALAIFRSPLELTPDIELPMLITITPYPGASPENVEDLVSRKIEDAVSTLNGVKNIQSRSMENMSMVVLEMEYGTNMDVAHMDLQEKVNMYQSTLPDDAQDPIIVEIDMNAMPFMMLSAAATGDIDLNYFLNEKISPEFEKLSGVASVELYGGNDRYVSVRLMDDRLRQYGLTMSSIIDLVAGADFSIPGGDADMGTQNLAIRAGVSYDTAESLRNIPITLPSGKVIRLSDVAAITHSTKDAESLSRYNGQDNVTLAIQKRQSASTLDVSKAVRKQMDKLNSADIGVHLDVVSDSSEMIVNSVKAVFDTLLLGILLSMVVLFLFFGDIKASCIVGSSMPISLLVTLILMYAMGFSLNMVSLGGMVVGVGMMVDNSIVVIESCFRRSVGEKQDFKQVALEGTKFVSASIAASTITTVVVFLPISLMKGISGQLFRQLGFTIIFSLTSSLICALTLVPLFFSIFKPREKREAPFSRFMHRTEIAYGNLIRRILPHKVLVVLTAVILLVGSFALLTQINMELIPQVDEGIVKVDIETRPGLQLNRVSEICAEIEALAASNPDVESYSLTGGGSGMNAMMTGNTNAAFTAYLRSDRTKSTDEIVEEWREKTRGMLDCDISVTSGSDSMGSMASSGGIEVVLSGSDLDVLKTAAIQVEDFMRENEQILRVSSSATKGSPQAKVNIDPLRASARKLAPIQIAGAINATLSGKKAATLTEKGQEYEVWVEYPKDRYQTVNDLSGLMLTNLAGQQVPLMDVATIEFSDSPQSIDRKNNQYLVTVTGQPNLSAKFTAKKEILSAVNAMSFPDGVTIAQSDADESMIEEFLSLGYAIAIAVLLVFMVMAMQFESPKFSIMVMLCVPFSLIGSFGLLFLCNATISLPSLMGFLTLVGTVVNNGILYVDTTNQYRRSMQIETALITAGRTRLRPILMTTLTTVLSMLPMAIGIGSGAEMMRGMAVVMIGGLCASTLLTLLLLPTFYLIFHRKKDDTTPQAPELNLEEATKGLDY